MTLKTLLTSCALGALSLAAFSHEAQAQTSRIYFAGYLGLNDFNKLDYTEKTTNSTGTVQVDNGNTFAGALGIRLTRQLRLEGEYSYSSGDLARTEINGVGSFDTTGELQSKIIFANLYYDFDVPWKIQPFIGGGLGYGWNSAEINDSSGLLSSTSSDAAGLMYNVGAGFKYRASNDLAFTAGYRYVDSFSDMTFGSYDVNMGSHELRIGLEWDLPVVAR